MATARQWLVTGANRGLGLALVEALSSRGDRVVATARRPQEATDLGGIAAASDGRVRVLPCSVESDESVGLLADGLGDVAIDVLVNNAAIGGADAGLEGLDLADVVRHFEVNAVGPLRLFRALLPRMRMSRLRRVVHVSTLMASLGDNTSGGWWSYRISKAALNMAVRNLAEEYGREGFVHVAMHPGWVRTEMGGAEAPLSAEESVRGMLKVIDRLDARDNGAFVDWQGKRLPW